MISRVRGVEKSKEDKNWKLIHVEWDKVVEPRNFPRLHVNIRVLT